EAAYELADRQRWDEALALLAAHGPRAGLLAVLAEAVRATPPLDAERAAPWIETLTVDEIVGDADLALACARLYEARGDAATAVQVLRRALAPGRAADQPLDGVVGSARLAAELARLAALEGPSGPLPSYGATLSEMTAPASAPRGRPRLRAVGALGGAGALVAAGAVAAGGAQPAAAFLLLLGAAVVLWVSQLFPESA